MNLDIKLHINDLPEELVLGDNIAIDCEFNGLNIKRDRLCLVQISTGKNDAHIIKFEKKEYNAPNFKKVITNDKIHKIFHFARADLTFIKHYLKINSNVENVDCTKIMSKIARSYSEKHGLKDLTKEFLGIDISKQLQSSDFGGELSQKQLQYAAQDCIYLHKIYDSLKKILIRENRLDIYEKTIKFINTRVDLDLENFSEDIWAH